MQGMTLQTHCTPRASIFDRNRRDIVLDLSDFLEEKIDGGSFFEENFITIGMKTLFEKTFARMENRGDQASTFLLTQSMGGGKTHNMIALGLLARDPMLRERVLGKSGGCSKLADVRVIGFHGRQTDAQASRPLDGLKDFFCADLTQAPLANLDAGVKLMDARDVTAEFDIWFTDPPYADAVNYHELTDYFLAWYERLLPIAFKDWRFQDVAALSVQGSGDDFKRSMVDIYSRLARQMPNNGLQLVQFTYQDPSVWGDLGMILWASGLKVTAAWTISTETAAGGIKKGNYVQGTVNLVLRKRTEQHSAWLDEIYPLIEDKVKRQLDSMIQLDDESEPNFGDTDYYLAAYAAALRVLTQFADIEGVDIRHELFRERTRKDKSEFEKVIDRAVEIAANHLIPRGCDEFHWKSLSAAERLYIKGLDLERHREARAGAYQELAKGFGVREYTHLYERSEANAVRFKTASESKRQQLGGDGFAGSLLRHVLYAISETVREENARAGLDYLKTDGSIDYWGKRKSILALLAYLKPLAHIGHMPHWAEDANAAERLAGAVENDH
jgi:putative DNA methylase